MRILLETGSHNTQEEQKEPTAPQDVQDAMFNPVASSGDVSIIDMLGRISNAKYKKAVEMLLLREIFSGIKKIVFFSKTENQKVQQIAEWLNTNYVDIFKVIYSYGVLPLNFSIKNEVMFIALIKKPAVRVIDDTLKCSNASVAIFADEMQLVGVPLKTLLRSLINDITEIIARDSQINKNLGLLGIVSRGGTGGNGVLMEGDMEKIEQRLNSRGEDFFGLITSESDLRFLKIELPIAQLQLSEKLQQKLQLACAVCGVPYILLNTGGNMTYENQTEARVKFYETTIKAFAEIMLEAGRKLIKSMPEMVRSTDLDYNIEQQTIKTTA